MYRLVIDPQQQQDQRIDLTPQQQHYLRGVVRLQNGDRFLSLNGQGKTWLTQLKENSGYIIQEIEENSELSATITLIVALPKGNGFDEIVRCCTELGVTALIPVKSERTLLNPSSHKVERWRKIATEAAEQSERQIVPKIVDPMSLKEALSLFKFQNTSSYFCVTRHKVDHLWIHLQKTSCASYIIVTGPEGGWTDTEVQMATDLGFTLVSLGNRILRAVTAPITAISLISASLESASHSSVISC